MRYRYRFAYNRHTQKLDPIRARYLALLLVHHQFQSLLDVSADAFHHPLSRLRRLHEDVAIVSKSTKLKAAPLQLFIQLVQDDVAE